MEVAYGEDQVLPVGVVNLFQELLVDEGGKSLVETSLETLGRFVCHLYHFLQQSQRESVVGLAGNPEAIVFVGLLSLRVAEGDYLLFNLFHEFQAKLTVLQNDPTSRFHACFNSFASRLFLTFSH